MREKGLSREAFEQMAERVFDASLKSISEAIQKHEIGGMAPVIFYAPEMKGRLMKFILTVQQSFESIGDVTGKQYLITLVSEHQNDLRDLKAELSKAGMLRGVRFIGDKSQANIEETIVSSVIRHPVFGAKFGIFFPEESVAQAIPEWQRVVRTEIPKEYGMLLLPALSRYFAQTATSDINATTLRQALPDLTASAAFRVGQGIAIVAAFLQHIAAAAREIAKSA
jgi:hypothetical protein